MVCKRVKDEISMDPNKKLIRNIMRSEFKLSYKRAKKLHPSVNSDKNIVLR